MASGREKTFYFGRYLDCFSFQILFVAMGQGISCECIENMLRTTLENVSSGHIDKFSELDIVKKETKFTRKAYLGLTTEDIYIKLSDDTSILGWRVPSTNGTATWAAVSGNSPEVKGEISMIDNIATVRSVDPNGLAIVDFSNKIVIEVYCDDISLRDQWVTVLNKLLQSWVSNPESKPKAASMSARNTSDKSAYFAKREKEMAENKKIADARKAKYTAGGMKYTAIAMMNRDN